MKRIAVLSAALCLLFLAASAFATEEAAKTVTLEGKMVCAKCTLHEKDRTQCQNVLVVEQGERKKEYYVAKNEAYDKYGEVCDGTDKVRATGTVKEEKGHTWIVATEIKKLEG
jgi:hypothetical protein